LADDPALCADDPALCAENPAFEQTILLVGQTNLRFCRRTWSFGQMNAVFGQIKARAPFAAERWRLAGWLGGVLAAEWEACASIVLSATFEGLPVRQRGRQRSIARLS